MDTTLAPTTARREEYRGTAKSLRSNAGIGTDDQVEAVADFGAAARRLRASVRGGHDGAVARRPMPASRRLHPAGAAIVVDDLEVIVDEPPATEGDARPRSRESVVLRLIRQRAAR